MSQEDTRIDLSEMKDTDPIISYGASGDTAFFKKHSNINGFRTPEQRNYLYSALLKQSISAAIARFISR